MLLVHFVSHDESEGIGSKNCYIERDRRDALVAPFN
jgi:hypothetical protein